jgi:hypothetical protein
VAPALLSGSLGDLWLYWSDTFIGTSIVALYIEKSTLSIANHKSIIHLLNV